MSYQLKDIFLGLTDGKKEALQRPDFDNFFYNYEQIAEKSLNPMTYIVLGKKGTGKSLLGEYIVKKTNNKDNFSSALISFKEFRFHELRELKSRDVAPNEYISIWTWILLIEFIRVILKNNRLKEDEGYKSLHAFIQSNFSTLILTAQTDADKQKLNNVNGEYLRPKSSSATSSYLDLVSEVENKIIALLKLDKGHKYYLILDELDDRFVKDDLYKNGIISLIKATDRINIIFKRNGFDSKILLLLRTDIFTILNDTDLNKLKRDNCISIDYGRRASYDSPLFDLILKKIKVSIPEFQDMHKSGIIGELFQLDVGRIKTDRFLLERTFFRPRDLVTYLNLVKDKDPYATKFTSKNILDVEREYSEYLYDEIRNELKGHTSDEIIEQITVLIRHQSKFFFRYTDIAKFENERKYLKDINLRDALTLMFNFGIIGNKWRKQHSKITYYTTKIRDERSEIDFNKEFVVHLGLRKAFQL